MKSDALSKLADVIARGVPEPEGGARKYLEALFGDRYQQKHLQRTLIRPSRAAALEADNDDVYYNGLVSPESSPSGPYGGTSLVWFPTQDGSLIDFGVGSRGLHPDEGILTRPGHRRRVAALRRYLARKGVTAWTKSDPSALGVPIPKVAQERFPGFEKVFARYGNELYCVARVPKDSDPAREVVQAFFDLYAFERGWQVLKTHEQEFNDLLAELRRDLFTAPTADEVNSLLRQRRFVVLQGPPGTGKTRLADTIRREHFRGNGFTVQFHPAVTYEDFVVGLSPDSKSDNLRFDVRRGWLLEAVCRAEKAPFLLVVDEINRGDLGKVLGEAIYLFETGEIGGEGRRIVRLPHPVDGNDELSLPDNLFVLATMNTADRSIRGNGFGYPATIRVRSCPSGSEADPGARARPRHACVRSDLRRIRRACSDRRAGADSGAFIFSRERRIQPSRAIST